MPGLVKSFHYKSRAVEVRTSEVRGLYTWHYVIDGVMQYELRQPGMRDEALAIQEAEYDARVKIDRMG